MKNNIPIPEYPDGTMQGISFMTLDDGTKRAVPQCRFVDKYSMDLWTQEFGKFSKRKQMGRCSVSEWIRHVIRNRCPSSHQKFLDLRRDCQRTANRIVPPRPFIERIKDRELTPDAFKYDRALGIEIECCRPQKKRIALPLWTREKSDGSLRPIPKMETIEYCLLIKRSELEMRLHRFCQLIADHKVNTSCGLHVHLDCRGKLEDDVRATAKRMTAWLIALKEFVPLSRRDNKDYAALSFSENNRYRAVNFTAFRKFKTLEIRLHSGTVDYTKIIAWIRLMELIFVLRTKPKKGLEGIAALSQLPLTEYERSYWMKRHQQLNPGQYSSTLPSTETE